MVVEIEWDTSSGLLPAASTVGIGAGPVAPLRRAVAIVIALVAAIVLLTPGISSADTQQPDPEPDRGTHTYCLGDNYLPNDIVEPRIHWSMGNLRDQTIVDIEWHHDPGCKPATDIKWQQRPIGDGYAGYTNCLDLNEAGRCDQWRIRIDYGLIHDLAGDPPAQVRKTVCHEIGHTVLLRHYSTTSPDAPLHSCMRSGLWDGGQEWTRTYGAHHVHDHINPDW